MLWFSFVDRALEVLDLEVKELQLASAGALVERHYPSLSPDRPALIGELDDPGLCRQLGARWLRSIPRATG